MLIPWILCGILCIIVVLLLIKILLLRKSMDDICLDLMDHVLIESNTLISISTSDKHIKHLVIELNNQLRLLRQQRWRYAHGDRELKEAVTNISHDLRTPLTAIYGYLELMEEEEKSATVERYIGIISNRVEIMKQLTEELFHYSLVTSSTRDVSVEKVILNDVLEESIAGYYVALKARHIEPKIQMPQRKVVRYLNSSTLLRIFSNLLNNAIKYSDGDLEIVLSEQGEITFTNTASGLNQVQVGKLFDRFYTVQTAEHATGLGLQITRTLVNQMNGRIHADYKNNQLCIFIQFPDKTKEV